MVCTPHTTAFVWPRIGDGPTEQKFIIFSSPVGSLCHTPGVVRRQSSVVCRLCPPELPEIMKLSNPYLVQMFIMFLKLCLLGIGDTP